MRRRTHWASAVDWSLKLDNAKNLARISSFVITSSLVNGYFAIRHFANFLLLATLLTGCGPWHLKTYPAGGKVLLADGTPLAGGKLVFYSIEHGLGAKSRIGEDGAFTLGTFEKEDGAVAGLHQAAVMRPIGNPDSGYTVPIEEKFMSATSSGLEFTVTEDDPNQFEVTVDYAGGRRGRPSDEIPDF